MIGISLRKKVQLLTVLTVLAMFLFATQSHAASKLIKADEGGIIRIARGIRLLIPPKALKEDTIIRARVGIEDDCICYSFGPDGTTFRKPALLIVSWQVLEYADVEDYSLYGEDGERIKSKTLKKAECMLYKLRHFSLYYHRRR